MHIKNDCTPEVYRTRGFFSAALTVCFSVLFAFGLLGTAPAHADHPGTVGVLTVVSGNAECIGGENFFKIENQIDLNSSGTFYINDPSEPGVTFEITLNGDRTFDWMITGGIVEQVGVKGGPDTARYTYNPPATSDVNLHSPITRNRLPGLSHISFCYNPGAPVLEATKVCDDSQEANPVFNDSNELVYTYQHTFTNASTGAFPLDELGIRESQANCSITKVGDNVLAVPVDVTTTDGSYTSIPGNPIVAVGDDLTIDVECTSATPLTTDNMIWSVAKTTDDTVITPAAKANAAQCPGVPVIEAVKVCEDSATNPRINATNDGLIYTYKHTFSNNSTGAYLMDELGIRESQTNCSITMVDGGAVGPVAVTTTDGNYTNVPTNPSIGFGEELSIEVECNSPTPLEDPNMIWSRAKLADDSVVTPTAKANAAQCESAGNPRVDITKDCSSTPIRLMQMDGHLAVEACVDIYVENIGNEDLKNVTVTDPLIPGLEDPQAQGFLGAVGNLDVNDGSTFVGTFCYMPDIPDAANAYLSDNGTSGEGEEGDDKWLVYSLTTEGLFEAMFNNTAYVEGESVIFGTSTTETQGLVSDSTNCSICYGSPGAACPNPADPLGLNTQ